MFTMKKEKKEELFLLYFFVLWLFPLVGNAFKIELLLLALGFIVSVVSTILIKKESVAAIISLVSMSAVCFAEPTYLFYLFFPTLAFCEYIRIFKNKSESENKKNPKKENFSPLNCNVSITFGFIVLVARAIITATSDNNFNFQKGFGFSKIIVVGMLFTLLCMNISLRFKKQSDKHIDKNKDFVKKLKLAHTMNFIGFAESLAYYFLIDTSQNSCSERVFFLPLIIYFALMIYYKDPVFINFIEKTEEQFNKKIVKAN